MKVDIEIETEKDPEKYFGVYSYPVLLAKERLNQMSEEEMVPCVSKNCTSIAGGIVFDFPHIHIGWYPYVKGEGYVQTLVCLPLKEERDESS
jgi:hypothetical protein